MYIRIDLAKIKEYKSIIIALCYSLKLKIISTHTDFFSRLLQVEYELSGTIIYMRFND